MNETAIFDKVAASLAGLPETARTRPIVEAWTHGIALRDSGITDVANLIDCMMSKTSHEDENEFMAESILCATSFCGCCGASEQRDISGLLCIFKMYNDRWL